MNEVCGFQPGPARVFEASATGSTPIASTGNNVFFNNTTDLGAGVTLAPATVH